MRKNKKLEGPPMSEQEAASIIKETLDMWRDRGVERSDLLNFSFSVFMHSMLVNDFTYSQFCDNTLKFMQCALPFFKDQENDERIK